MRTLYILLLAVFLFSCENEIPYNLDNITPKLTMNAVINADSLVNKLYLNFTGTTKYAMVDYATVEVSINGELKETLKQTSGPNEADRQKEVVIRSRFQPGDRVRIDAYTPDGKYHAWVEETVPQRLGSISVDTVSTPYRIPSYSMTPIKQLRFNVRIKDRPGENNYYRIVMEQRYVYSGKDREGNETSTIHKDYEMWPWDDVVLTDGQPVTFEELDSGPFERVKNIYGVFDDKRFADSEYTMQVSASFSQSFYSPIYDVEHLNVYAVVRLLSITESQFYYLNVLNYIDSDVADEYLTDPVMIPSNVNGGTGFVLFSTETSEIVHTIVNYKTNYKPEDENWNWN